MISENLSRRIAKKLSEIWELHKHPEDFKAYIARMYNRIVGSVPTFDCLYIAECEEGDLKKGSLGGIVARLWVVNDTGMSLQRRIDIAENEEDEFYKRPMIRFFLEGSLIVVGERLGPQYICRSIGSVGFHDDELELSDLKTMWTSDTL